MFKEGYLVLHELLVTGIATSSHDDGLTGTDADLRARMVFAVVGGKRSVKEIVLAHLDADHAALFIQNEFVKLRGRTHLQIRIALVRSPEAAQDTRAAAFSNETALFGVTAELEDLRPLDTVLKHDLLSAGRFTSNVECTFTIAEIGGNLRHVGHHGLGRIGDACRLLHVAADAGEVQTAVA